MIETLPAQCHIVGRAFSRHGSQLFLDPMVIAALNDI